MEANPANFKLWQNRGTGPKTTLTQAVVCENEGTAVFVGSAETGGISTEKSEVHRHRHTNEAKKDE